MGVINLLVGLPRWALPIALFGLHYVMIFRGLLFAALISGSGNARLRAFQAASRR
jgi:C4-dicarboxylate transporter